MPKNDDHFTIALKEFGTGIRQLNLEPVETLFSFICSSNNNISRISQMVNFLATKGNFIAEIEGERFFEFPTVEQLRG